MFHADSPPGALAGLSSQTSSAAPGLSSRRKFLSPPFFFSDVRLPETDKRVVALVRAFLKAGVLTELGDREESYSGTPQGGPLSPLLANIALSAVDEHFHRQWQESMGTGYQLVKGRKLGVGNWCFISFA